MLSIYIYTYVYGLELSHVYTYNYLLILYTLVFCYQPCRDRIKDKQENSIRLWPIFDIHYFYPKKEKKIKN